jgi:hypothetical protein
VPTDQRARELRSLPPAGGFLPPAVGSGRRARQTAIRASIARELRTYPVSVLRENVRTCYRLAHESERTSGMGWYPVAHELASELGEGVSTGAAVIAALSPQIGWLANISAARSLVASRSHEEAQSIGALGDGISKALAILEGSPPSLVLGGRKVRSFYRNILYPSRAGAVTVDRHAVAIALHGIGGRSPSDKWLERAGTYALVASIYRSEARRAGILPQQLQAICWLAHRRELDGKASGNLRAAHIAQRANTPAPAPAAHLSDGTEDF